MTCSHDVQLLIRVTREHFHSSQDTVTTILLSSHRILSSTDVPPSPSCLLCRSLFFIPPPPTSYILYFNLGLDCYLSFFFTSLYRSIMPLSYLLCGGNFFFIMDGELETTGARNFGTFITRHFPSINPSSSNQPLDGSLPTDDIL